MRSKANGIQYILSHEKFIRFIFFLTPPWDVTQWDYYYPVNRISSHDEFNAVHNCVNGKCRYSKRCFIACFSIFSILIRIFCCHEWILLLLLILFSIIEWLVQWIAVNETIDATIITFVIIIQILRGFELWGFEIMTGGALKFYIIGYCYWPWKRNTNVDGALRTFSTEWDNKMTSRKYFESIRDLSPNPQRERDFIQV